LSLQLHIHFDIPPRFEREIKAECSKLTLNSGIDIHTTHIYNHSTAKLLLDNEYIDLHTFLPAL
jgi:hypothetical protein